MASAGYISSVCIDEAHAVVEQSRSFRPEFKAAIQSIKNIIAISKIHHPGIDIPMLVMSATFRIPEQKAFNYMIGDTPELVMWGDMDRRSVGIYARVDGEPLSHLVNSWSDDTRRNPDMKSLIMTNSARACDGRIIDRLEAAAKKLPNSVFDKTHGFMSFTGDCGLMMKMFLMECFCGESDEDAILPTIVCMPCTAAAHCGVSSKKCKQCYRYGPCPNWYDLVQEAGRVDRLLNALRGMQRYTIFLNVPTFLILWLRIQSEENAAVRERHSTQLFEVLRFLVLPDKCYHEAIEEHFENPETYNSRGPCEDNCSYCLGHHVHFAGEVSKAHVIGALQANIFRKGSVDAKRLVSLITDKNHKYKLSRGIWGKKVESGKVHGLVLMMIASGMLQFELKSQTLIGKNNLKLDHVRVVLAESKIMTSNGACDTLSINDETLWHHFHLR
jgi:superfamily II DNA helicase RecQ